VQGLTADPEADVNHQREVVEAFLAAARGGDFEALLSVLDLGAQRTAAYRAELHDRLAG